MRWRPGLTAMTTGLFLAAGLCARQFGDRNGMNSMTFEEVKALASDPQRARLMAQQGNVDLFVGKEVAGQMVKLRGELTDGNCFLDKGIHAYDHAFCAKACVAAGSPVVFISDDDGKVYSVITPRNGVAVPEKVMDLLGIPGITVRGRVSRSQGMNVLAVESAE